MDNTPQSDQPVDTSLQPSKHKLYIIIGVALVLLLVCVALFARTHRAQNDAGSQKDTNSGSANRSFRGSGATIGDFKSIGACNFLTFEDIDDAFGAGFMKPLRSTTESYYDVSAPNPRVNNGESPYVGECRYASTEAGARQSVTVTVAQYPTQVDKDNKFIHASDITLAQQKEIAALQTKFDGKLNATGKAFLESVMKTNDELSKSINKPSSEVSKLVDNKVVFSTVSGIGFEFGFEQYHSNYVVTVDAREDIYSREPGEISDDDYVKMINGIARLSSEIHARSSKDDSIRQPGPTSVSAMLPGNSKIAIKDSCNVLTPELFESITGVKENTPLERGSFPELSKNDTKSDSVNVNRFSTSCKRHYNASDLNSAYAKSPAEQTYGINGSVRVIIEIAHANSTTLADSAMKDFRIETSKLTTSFDEAYQNSYNSNLARVRSGNYLIDVSVSKEIGQTRDARQEVQLSRDEMTTILNKISKQL